MEMWPKRKSAFYKLLPLFKAMFFETNPIPIKTAAALMGLMDEEMRLPLCPMDPVNLQKLKQVMADYGLL